MRRILLVEDNENDAVALMRHLRREDISTFLAESMEVMHFRISQEHFDCVVLDLSFGEDPYQLISIIPELGIPVVVYTGNTDSDIVKAVRATGAAYVEKPGLDLLVEKIWSQINFKSPDDESAVRQQRAQRALRTARPLFASKAALFGVVLSLVTATGGFSSWAWENLSKKVSQAEDVKHKFELINAKTTSLEESVRKMESLIDLIRNQNQISIDDRNALRESQKELKADIKERLERIERKLDARGASSFPINPPVAVK